MRCVNVDGTSKRKGRSIYFLMIQILIKVKRYNDISYNDAGEKRQKHLFHDGTDVNENQKRL